MIGASFNKVSGDGMALQDLQPVGYENVSYFTEDMEAVMGEFSIKILNNGGGQAYDKEGKEAAYYFNRSYDSSEGKWLDDGVWTYLNGEEPDNIVFDNGEGLWFYVSPDAYPEGSESYSLMNAGEALLDAGSVPLRQGSKGVVATLSAAVPLQKIQPTGYEAVEYFTTDMEAVMGEFSIKILNNGGGQALDKDGKEAAYYFNRSYDTAEGKWLDDGVWTYLNGEVPNNIVFELGEGLWVYVSPDAFVEGSEEYYLEFPGIDDLAK